ncbi:KEOPS complex subunit Cgi121 [Candidatus Nitrosotenuis sp. DW1]|uniref:KEOPS complex subunit Cgi121 n=1 Tax=Candidatus Nitrosotenuis sp. DW1 TaxID=2259672 RepID=UPI002105DF4F|nr:KEOPS complex subunit Cgi121 [Candidatus Nitrosotenuis sp. DW1]
MLSIKLLGGAKKSFGTDLLQVDLDGIPINALLEHLLSIKPKDTMTLDTKNILVAVNGVDSSALDGYDTVLRKNDVVTIIPIIHGGAHARNRFQVCAKSAELFCVRVPGKNYDFLNSARKNFPDLTLEGISSRHILGVQHAKKIVGLSLFAQKHNSLLSKKLETDILLRFGMTTQISDAVKTVGIANSDVFAIIAIGKKSSLDGLYEFLEPFLTRVSFENNSGVIQKQFKITKRHLGSVDSKTPLEDILAEKAAVLIR